MPLTKSAIRQLPKNVLVPIEVTGVESAADVGIYSKVLGSGTTKRVISN